MKIYTVEVFMNGESYETVLATHDKEKALSLNPSEYDSDIKIVYLWYQDSKVVIYSDLTGYRGIEV